LPTLATLQSVARCERFASEYDSAFIEGIAMSRVALLLVLVAGCALALAADSARFVGRVVVEWLDDDPFIPSLRLVEDFGFQDGQGNTFLVPKGSVLDGRSLPPTFRDLFGGPFVGQYRKTSVIYDHLCRSMSEQWKVADRLFYHAAVAEGVEDNEAKQMYMTLYAGGLRWEPKGSTCYSHCHTSASALTWKPDLQDLDLKPIAGWIRETSPSVEAIDAKLDQLIKRPGPHVFVQAR
jgi:hypothetical protein